MNEPVKAVAAEEEVTPIISLRGIRRSFRPEKDSEIEVLRGLDLDIMPGTFTVIRGESGSGKTTLLRILGLLDSGFAGAYELAGVDVARRPDWWLDEMRAANIGFIFQDGQLFEHVSVAGNVTMPLRLAGADAGEIAGRLDGLSRDFFSPEELEKKDILGADPKTCSGGQKQRASVLRSIMHDPVLILADEPTASLDEERKHEILDRLKALAAAGHTVVVVTHDKLFYDHGRQLEMEHGQLVDHGGGETAPGAARRDPVLPPEGRAILYGWRPRVPIAIVGMQALREAFQRVLFLLLILSALIVGVTQISVFSSVIRGTEQLVDQAFRQGSRLNRMDTKPRRSDLEAEDRFPIAAEVAGWPDVQAVVPRRETYPKLINRYGDAINYVAMGLHDDDPEYGLFEFSAGGPFTEGNLGLEVIITKGLLSDFFDFEDGQTDISGFIGTELTLLVKRFSPTREPLEPLPVTVRIQGVILAAEGGRQLYLPNRTALVLQRITQDRAGELPPLITPDGAAWALPTGELMALADWPWEDKLHIYTTGIREIIPVIRRLSDLGYKPDSDIWNYKWALDIEDIAWTIFTPLLILITVAVALTLVTNIYTSAKLRQREFALWRVLGMRRGDLALMQLLTSVVAILVGAVAGLALAWLLVDQARGFLAEQYADADFDQIFAPVSDFFGLILIGALVLGTISALIPALRTARVDPAKVLQS